MDKKPLENKGIQVINGSEGAVAKGVEFMHDVKTKMDLCYESDAPSIVIEVNAYKNGYMKIRKNGGKIRVITEITKNNIKYCKELMKIVDELRHLDDVKGGIAVSDSAYMTTTILQESKPLTQVVYSDVIEAVHQQQNFFDSLWERAIPSKQKIRDITNEVDVNQNNIFSAINNNIRRSILFYLKGRNMKISQLAKKLNITIQAFQKHFIKLNESGLIEKNQMGMLELTQTGIALTKQIPSIQFLFDNKKFFETHSLSFLPTKFVQQIGSLQESDLINDAAKNTKKFYELVEESTKQVKFIDMPSVLDVKNEIFSKIFQKDIKMQYILDVNSKIPKKWIEFTEKIGEEDLISQGIIQKRMTSNSHIMMFTSEKSAGLMFPKLNGDIDIQNLWHSKDKKFIDWCTDYFDHVWQNSHSFVKQKINEG